MKIFSAAEIQAWDQASIKAQNIRAWDLMERAALSFTNWFCQSLQIQTQARICLVCGKGNNGGDALAIARILQARGFVHLQIILAFEPENPKLSPLCQENLTLLSPDLTKHYWPDIQTLKSFDYLIDGLFGTGLKGPVQGSYAELIHWINQQDVQRIALDLPSGLLADQSSLGPCVEAHHSFAFETPRLSFMFPENDHYVGQFHFESIGLDKNFEQEQICFNHYVDLNILAQCFKQRSKFGHKGVFGHALLIAGSHGKMGAAILATKACLRAGAGLVTAHVPTCGYEVLQIAVPEAMVSLDEDQFIFTRIYDLQRYTTIALGCGLSTKNKTRNALCYVLKNLDKPVVLDADALNILAQSPDWLEFIPKNSLLTPHPKEFERMFGTTANSFERNALQRQKAKELGVYILLKGANSCLACPDGHCYFNPTGNPGMGTAGSGDVLTGILAGLLAQGYSPWQAGILGVYLHGLAGDLAAIEQSQEGLMASHLIDYLGAAFLQVRQDLQQLKTSFS